MVTVYGAERIGGQVGVWMSLVDGPTLEDELRAQGPFDPLTVAGIGLDLCGALDAVHRAGVVHHDVKAQNVMRAADGRIVLADFGAGSDASGLGTGHGRRPRRHAALSGAGSAREASGIARRATSTASAWCCSICSPDRSRSPAARSTTCARPTPPEQRRRVREVRPDVPTRLSRIVDRCLAPNPADRFQDVAAVAQALRGASGRAWTARRVVTTAAVVLTVVAVSFALWRYGRSQPAPPAPGVDVRR